MNRTNGRAETLGSGRISGSQVHRTEDGFTLLVGTFKSPEIYTLKFQPPAPPSSSSSSTSELKTTTNTTGTLTISHKSPAAGGHSWLSLSPSHNNLYTTVWSSPPLIAAYALDPNTKVPTLLNTARVASLSGYVAPTPSGTHLLSVGGPTGEVFRLRASDGGLDDAASPVQTLSFRTPAELNDGRRDGVAHGAFGGLRWGAHSVDLSPDGRTAYVADIGHNCIWTYSVTDEGGEGGQGAEVLTQRVKHVAPRAGDGPRHCWPHPNGRVVYCVQEHSGMVDAFAVDGSEGGDGAVKLAHMHGHSLLPPGKAAGEFWADEVRTSNLYGDGGQPRWLYASTRGLEKGTKGYVAVFELDEQGAMCGPAVEIYETRTSGGLANAVEPAPRALYEQLGADGSGEEFLALTDSEEGWVVVLGWDGKRFREVAAVRLEGAEAATAVWV